jgi:type II secretory pathway component PulF
MLISRGRLSDMTRIALFDELKVLLEAGTALPHALDAIAAGAGDGGPTAMARAAQEAHRRVASGSNIADALKPYLDPSEYHQLAAALQTDETTQIGALERMAARLQSDRDLAKQFSSDMLFPMLAFLTSLGAIAIPQEEISKQLAIIPPHHEWSPIVALYLGLAEFLLHWWFTIPAVIVAAVLAYRYSAPRLVGPAREFLESIPFLPYRFYRRREGIAFIRRVADLLQAGYGLADTLRLCAQGASPYSLHHIDRIARQAATSSLGHAIEQTGDPWPDRAVARKLRLFARSKTFAHQVAGLADYWHREFARSRAFRVEMIAAALNFGGILLLIFQMASLQFLSFEMGDAILAATYQRSEPR